MRTLARLTESMERHCEGWSGRSARRQPSETTRPRPMGSRSPGADGTYLVTAADAALWAACRTPLAALCAARAVPVAASEATCSVPVAAADAPLATAWPVALAACL